jgi:hypothetical protein
MFFEGINNDTPILEVYEARRFTKSFTDILAGPTDFWYDDYLYGRVDQNNNAIFLSEAFLKEIRTNDQRTIFTLNFISDALSDMKADFEQIAETRLSKDSQIVGITPYRAWTSMHEPYAKYMEDARKIFTNEHGEICGFETFWIQYLSFLKRKVYPFTRTGYIKSKFCDPRTTGLFISLFRIDPTDDGAKKEFYEDKNFRFYYSFIRKYGFVLDVYNPSRIVADLRSAPMKRYMEKYDLTLDSFFDEYYYKTEDTDFELFKIYVCNLFNQQLSRENRPKLIAPEDIGDRFLAKQYMVVRFQEEGVTPSSSFEKKYLQLFDRSGIMPAVKFLNSKIKRSNASVPSNR